MSFNQSVSHRVFHSLETQNGYDRAFWFSVLHNTFVWYLLYFLVVNLYISRSRKSSLKTCHDPTVAHKGQTRTVAVERAFNLVKLRDPGYVKLHTFPQWWMTQFGSSLLPLCLLSHTQNTRQLRACTSRDPACRHAINFSKQRWSLSQPHTVWA